MKNVFFMPLILASSLSYAAPGIGRFEQKQILPRQVAALTGLQEQDSRYATALTNCAKNDPSVFEDYQKIVQYLNSNEYKYASPAHQKEDRTMLIMSLKMLCSIEIRALGINP